MKVIGKLMGDYHSELFVSKGYAAFDINWIHVTTYSGHSVENDNRCYLRFATSFVIADIKSINGDYLTPELANSLVKKIASLELFDLDEHDLGFFSVRDVRPDSIAIRNEWDENYNTIPLEVVAIDSKDSPVSPVYND